MSSSEGEESSAGEDSHRQLTVYERKMLLKRSKKMRPDGEAQDEEEPEENAEEVQESTTGTALHRGDGQLPPRGKYINKQRVLIFCSRGIPHRYRHLLNDLRRLLPHSKKENKMDPRATLPQINEIAETKSCNSCIFFEVRYAVVFNLCTLLSATLFRSRAE